jgi:glycosyltransferase involved in cell wall biosynthesis
VKLVSIVMPAYNSAGTISGAIQSCLDQTYKNVEVVVIDDGSKDDTATIASQMPRTRVLSQANSGVSVARNRGIQESQGEIVALLDADDALLPECITARAPHLEDPGVAACVGAFYIVDEHGVRQPNRDEKEAAPETNLVREVMRRNWGATCGALFRREAVLEIGGFDPSLRGCEDWDLLIRLCARYRFAYDPVPRAEYRVVQGSLSRDMKGMYDSALAVMRKNRKLSPGWWAYVVDSNMGLYNHCMGMIFSRMKAGQLGSDAKGRLARLMLARPRVFLFFMLWMLRAARNRILRRR